ncbi:14214_t:CDS:2, partial [Funneliformis mosseae]
DLGAAAAQYHKFKGNVLPEAQLIHISLFIIASNLTRIDEIDNKLVLLSDKIISIKNEVLQQYHNQGDIDYHLSRLKFFTEILDKDEGKPTMEIVNELIQKASMNTVMNNQ